MAQSSSTGHCPLCKKPITDQDFETQNFVIGAGIQHKKCPKEQCFGGFWQNQFISTESQYSHQSAGSCTINALETAIRLQLGEEPSVALINNVLVMASLYTSSMHTGVSDVLPHVTRYNSVLKSIDWMQCSVQQIRKVVERLNKDVVKSKHDVSCVITKPPESIFLHKVYKSGHYILYDSHPRPEKGLNGSHFLVFPDGELLCDYLGILFPFVNLGGGYGLYGDMMNQCEANFLQIDYKKWKDIDVLRAKMMDEIDYTAMSKDLSKIGFKLQTQFLNNQKRMEQNKNNNKKGLNVMDKVKGFKDKMMDKVLKNKGGDDMEKKEQKDIGKKGGNNNGNNNNNNNNNKQRRVAMMERKEENKEMVKVGKIGDDKEKMDNDVVIRNKQQQQQQQKEEDKGLKKEVVLEKKDKMDLIQNERRKEEEENGGDGKERKEEKKDDVVMKNKEEDMVDGDDGDDGNKKDDDGGIINMDIDGNVDGMDDKKESVSMEDKQQEMKQNEDGLDGEQQGNDNNEDGAGDGDKVMDNKDDDDEEEEEEEEEDKEKEDVDKIGNVSDLNREQTDDFVKVEKEKMVEREKSSGFIKVDIEKSNDELVAETENVKEMDVDTDNNNNNNKDGNSSQT